MIFARRALTEQVRSSRFAARLAALPADLAAVLDRDRKLPVLLLASFLLGAAYCLWLFDFGFLSGRSSFWINSRGIFGVVNHDVSTALSGYYFFVLGHWHLPLFEVRRLAIPHGIPIIFTDSIPVLALIGRVIYRLTGEALNLFGWWTAACFVLLGMSLTGLVAMLGQRNIAAAVAATGIGLCMPPLLERWGNPALMAHFEIVLALIFYVACKRGRGARPCFLWGAGLLVLALWTNPYIFLMVGGIAFAAIVQSVLDGRLRLAAGAAVLAGLGAVVLAVMLVSGYLPAPGSASAAGFGHWSMNLLSPVIPQISGLVPTLRFSVLDATGGQYEGFNYMGMGVLLLLVLAVPVRDGPLREVARDWRRRLQQAWRGHACLLLVLLGFAVVAPSNIVFIGYWKALVVPLPAWLLHLLGVFRSSGRLFWPVLYALTAAAIVGAAGRRPRLKALVLLGACLLQWLDAAPLRGLVAASAATAVPPLINAAAWRQALSRHAELMVFPPFACLLDQPPLNWNDNWNVQVALQLQLLAGIEGVATNTVYAGRGSDDCPRGEIEAGAAFRRPPPGVLAVFLSGFPRFAELQAAGGAAGSPCRATPRLVVCSQEFRRFDPRELLEARPAR